MFYIFVGLLMAGSFVGMIVCAKKQAGFPLARKLMVVFFIAVVGCAAAILTRSMSGGDYARLVKYEETFARSAAEMLGRNLAQAAPGSKALIVVAATHASPIQQSYLDQLKSGLGPGITVIAVDSPDLQVEFAPRTTANPNPPGTQFPAASPTFDESQKPAAAKEGEPPADAEAKPETPAPATGQRQVRPDGQVAAEGEIIDFPEIPIEELLLASHFNDLLDKYPQCNLIISLIGLPRDAENLNLLQQEEAVRPRIAILSGKINGLKNAILGKLVIAVVADRPDANRNDPPPDNDLPGAFAMRYLMITPDNIEEIDAKYPGLFHMTQVR